MCRETGKQGTRKPLTRHFFIWCLVYFSLAFTMIRYSLGVYRNRNIVYRLEIGKRLNLSRRMYFRRDLFINGKNHENYAGGPKERHTDCKSLKWKNADEYLRAHRLGCAGIQIPVDFADENAGRDLKCDDTWPAIHTVQEHLHTITTHLYIHIRCWYFLLGTSKFFTITINWLDRRFYPKWRTTETRVRQFLAVGVGGIPDALSWYN